MDRGNGGDEYVRSISASCEEGKRARGRGCFWVSVVRMEGFC